MNQVNRVRAVARFVAEGVDEGVVELGGLLGGKLLLGVKAQQLRSHQDFAVGGQAQVVAEDIEGVIPCSGLQNKTGKCVGRETVFVQCDGLGLVSCGCIQGEGGDIEEVQRTHLTSRIADDLGAGARQNGLHGLGVGDGEGRGDLGNIDITAAVGGDAADTPVELRRAAEYQRAVNGDLIAHHIAGITIGSLQGLHDGLQPPVPILDAVGVGRTFVGVGGGDAAAGAPHIAQVSADDHTPTRDGDTVAKIIFRLAFGQGKGLVRIPGVVIKQIGVDRTPGAADTGRADGGPQAVDRHPGAEAVARGCAAEGRCLAPCAPGTMVQIGRAGIPAVSRSADDQFIQIESDRSAEAARAVDLLLQTPGEAAAGVDVGGIAAGRADHGGIHRDGGRSAEQPARRPAGGAELGLLDPGCADALEDVGRAAVIRSGVCRADEQGIAAEADG